MIHDGEGFLRHNSKRTGIRFHLKAWTDPYHRLGAHYRFPSAIRQTRWLVAQERLLRYWRLRLEPISHPPRWVALRPGPYPPPKDQTHRGDPDATSTNCGDHNGLNSPLQGNDADDHPYHCDQE